MPQITLTLALCFTCVATGLAQSDGHCGTELSQEAASIRDAYRAHLAEAGHADPAGTSETTAADTLFLPVVIHRIAKSDGTGGVSASVADDALRTANRAFAAGSIKLVACGPSPLIRDDAFFVIESRDEDQIGRLRERYQVEGVLNVYVPSGLGSKDVEVCGYTDFPFEGEPKRDVLFVAAKCFGFGFTFPHEVGHYLGLYHTHGKGVCDGTTELVDGSNCETAGDNLCDTPADPNLRGIDCSTSFVDEDCNYTGTVLDANGDAYAPDVTNIMSFTREGCAKSFTPEQLEVARFYLSKERNYLTGCGKGGGGGTPKVCGGATPTLAAGSIDYTSVTLEYPASDSFDAYELEYTVGGGSARTQPASKTGEVSITGLQTCTELSARIRGICSNGVPGKWSERLNVETDGCDLTHCVQVNGKSFVYVSALTVGGIKVPEGTSEVGYSLFEDVIGVSAPPSGPYSLPISLTVATDTGAGGDEAYVGVWIDANVDGVFSTVERVLTRTVDLDKTSNFTVGVAQNLSRDVELPMRITLGDKPITDPCAAGGGETVDLRLKISNEEAIVVWKPSSLRLGPESSTGTVELSAGGAWSISETPTWFTLDPASGSDFGEATLNYTVSANRGCTPREGVIRLSSAGKTANLVISQATNADGISVLSEKVIALPSGGGEVRAQFQSFAFFGVTSSEWVPRLDTTKVSGTYTKVVRVGPNTSASERRGFVAASGCGERVQVSVVQAGRTAAKVAWAESQVSFEARSRPKLIRFTASGAWSITDVPNWLLLDTVSGNASGGQKLSLGVRRNVSCSNRTARIKLSSGSSTATLVVSQRAPAPKVSLLTDANIVLPASGGTVSAALVSTHRYNVTGRSWLSAISATERLDTSSVSTTVPANPGTGERVATVIGFGCGDTTTLTVRQAAPDIATVQWSSDTLRFGPSSFQSIVSFASSGAWTIDGTPSWFTLNGAAGASTTNSLDFTLVRNSSCAPRVARLVLDAEGISDQLTIVQEPAEPAIEVLSSDTVTVGPLGGGFEVVLDSEHEYSISSDAWINVNPVAAALDETELPILIPTFAEGTERSGFIEASGCGELARVTVIQEAPLTYWNNVSEVQLAPGVDTFSLAVASNVDWEVSTDRDWLDVQTDVGSADGRVVLQYLGGADIGDIARVRLAPELGVVTGSELIVVSAPDSTTTSTTEAVPLALKLVGANPFGGELKLRPTLPGQFEWTVHDLTGRVFARAKATELSLDSSTWPAGLYLVAVRDQEGNRSIRRVVHQ